MRKVILCSVVENMRYQVQLGNEPELANKSDVNKLDVIVIPIFLDKTRLGVINFCFKLYCKNFSAPVLNVT